MNSEEVANELKWVNEFVIKFVNIGDWWILNEIDEHNEF